MLVLTGEEAYTRLMKGVKQRTYRYPTKKEAGFKDGYILPSLKIPVDISDKNVFTIGSCFAREIENVLMQKQIDVPVANFVLPYGEFDHPAPHLLNEYNAGTILQRLNNTFGNFEYTNDMGIEQTKDGYLDLFLHIHQKPVSLERLYQRREEINDLYKEMLKSSLVVITLGLVEAWYDKKYGCYLNKAPSKKMIHEEPNRFEFRRLDVEDVFGAMDKAIESLMSHSSCDVLITVSPIPIEATFTGNNAVMANFYSKSVLRVVAQLLSEKYDRVHYFPSYEIAISRGTPAFGEDNVHVTEQTVHTIMTHLFNSFETNQAQPVSFEPSAKEYNYVDEEIKSRLSNEVFDGQFDFKDERIRLTMNAHKTDKGILPNVVGFKNMLTFGPYINLQRGKYKLKINLVDNTVGVIEVELTSDNGNNIIDVKNINTIEDLAYAFTLMEDCHNFEVRIYALEGFSGGIIGYDIENLK